MIRGSTSALHGRADELAVFMRCLDVAASGRAQAVFVEGEAGIGKTRLTVAAVEEAEQRGMRVFHGAAEELEQIRPFATLAEALRCAPSSPDPRRAELAELLTADAQFRVLDGFVGLIEAEALRDPVVLVLEDLHWADQSTLLAVRAVIRSLSAVPVVLLATYRPTPRSPELERIVEAAEAEGGCHLVLEPLADAAVAALVADAVGAEPGAGLLAQVAGAAGNPLFVTELVAALAQEGLIERDDAGADVRDDGIPPSLRPTILRRIGFLPENTLAALRIAAILGSAFSVADLATVMQRSAVDLVEPLEEARRAGLLQEEGERMRFRHDLIREAIYDDLPASVRAALHTEAGHALAASNVDVLRVAEQFALGAVPGNREAVEWLVRGARQVAASAPRASTGLLRRALELLAPDDALYDELRAELAGLLALGGGAVEAEALAREIISGEHQASLEGSVRLTIVRALFAQGRWAELVEEARVGAGSAAVPDDARARMLAESCLARLWCQDAEGAAADGEEAVRLGRIVGDALATSLGLSHLSALSGMRGDLGESVELAREGLAAATTEDAARRHPYVPLAITLMDVDRFDDAEEQMRAGMRLGEQLGTVWDLPIYHTLLGFSGFRRGSWDDAIAEAEAGLALGAEIGSHPVSLAAHSLLGAIAVHRDELATARAEVAAAWQIAEESGPQWSQWLLVRAQALLEEAQGDPEAAMNTLAAAWGQFEAGGVAHSQLYMGDELVRLALEVGERALARETTERLEALAERARVPHTEGLALLARGLVEDDGEILERAAAAYGSAGRVREAAAAAEAAALRVDGGERALALLEDAIGAYENLGARRDLARALAAVRGLGLKRGRRGARKRPETGWESLTPSELQVARLAVEGLTNPQIGERLFISRRTVQTHLSHVFTKLGLASRVELAAFATRRDPD